MAIRSLSISTPPSKLLFIPGIDPDPKWPGLSLQGEWDQMGGAKIDTASCEFSGYAKDKAGKQTVRVAYEGASATFGVEVMALASIDLNKPPAKIDYNLGDDIELAGLEVYGNYTSSDPAKKEKQLIPTNQFVISGFDSQRVGKQQKVTATVLGQSVSFFVNVTVPVLEWPAELVGSWGRGKDNGWTVTFAGRTKFTMTFGGGDWELLERNGKTYKIRQVDHEDKHVYTFKAIVTGNKLVISDVVGSGAGTYLLSDNTYTKK
jgi:hypothetical protein